MTDSAYQDLFPLGPDTTPYRKLTSDLVGTGSFDGQSVLTVAPEALTMLTREAFRDISHLLRPVISPSCAPSSTTRSLGQ